MKRYVSLLTVVVKLLDDSCGVLDHLGVATCRVLGKRVDNASDAHLLEFLPAFLVDTKVANREECNASRRLAGTLIVSNYV